MDKTNQVVIYEHLARHEECMAELYRTFGKIFPETADFWNQMAEEESSQAKMLYTLKCRYEAGQGQLRECKLKSTAIQYSLDYVNQKIESARNGEITSLKEALVIAYDLENAVIEKEVFAMFEENSPAITQVLEKLYDDNLNQRKKVFDLIEGLKSGRDIRELLNNQASKAEHE